MSRFARAQPVIARAFSHGGAEGLGEGGRAFETAAGGDIGNDHDTEPDHPSHGRIRLPGFPVTLSGTPSRIRQAPEFGEHTEEVLIDTLGLDWDEVTALREREII